MFSKRHLALIVWLSSLSPLAAAESACTCADLADLRNRYCEARAANDEYWKQIGLIRQHEGTSGTPVKYTPGLYSQDVQPCVQEAINSVTDAGANRPTADTNNACQISYSGPVTPCLKEILTAHESVHVTVCQAAANDRINQGFFAELRGMFADFRDGTTLVDLLNEERSAYNVELNRIRDAIQKLSQGQPPCPGLPVQPPGPRLPSIGNCPSPRPRPDQKDSNCKHR